MIKQYLSFSYLAANKSEPTVADQGERSVQSFGGDGPHVEATNTREASAPLTSTPKKEVISTRNAQPVNALSGRDSQSIVSGTQQAGDLGELGKLVITLTETMRST